MAVNIPTSAVRQPDESESTNTSGNSRTIAYKGPYAALKSAKYAIKTGDKHDGGVVKVATLRRMPGDLGLLELTLALDLDEKDEQGNTVQKALRAVWTCKSVRNDKSILAYCGTKEETPNRAWIESWMAERDADIAGGLNYRKEDGTISDISQTDHHAATSDLIEKIKAGIDSVVRFYPVLTCTATYADIPNKFIEKLGYIDDPKARSADETKAPDNLASVISAYKWLKVQDDVNETGDGNWQRVESWMGSENGWDENLYGANRWPMPYDHSKS